MFDPKIGQKRHFRSKRFLFQTTFCTILNKKGTKIRKIWLFLGSFLFLQRLKRHKAYSGGLREAVATQAVLHTPYWVTVRPRGSLILQHIENAGHIFLKLRPNAIKLHFNLHFKYLLLNFILIIHINFISISTSNIYN